MSRRAEIGGRTNENDFFAAIRAAIMKAVPNVHSVTIAASLDSAGLSPVSEPTLATLFSVSPLPRFRVVPSTVSVTLAGPN